MHRCCSKAKSNVGFNTVAYVRSSMMYARRGDSLGKIETSAIKLTKVSKADQYPVYFHPRSLRRTNADTPILAHSATTS
jgi:hypothetical protein